MKKLIGLIFTLISLTLSVQAWDYHLLPDSNAAWQVRFWIGPGYPNVYYYYYMDSTNNDTTINGNTYGKLYLVQQGPNTSYVGALRENDTSQVYFCPKDSLNEYLLFDYSKHVGDTVHVYGFGMYGPPGQNGFDLVVQAKDSVLLVNRYQRHLFLSNAINWIEGVGSNWGLLENYPFISVSGTTTLLCMNRNDTTWQQGNYSLVPCSLITESVSENILENYFSIYPNPVQDSFTIISNFEDLSPVIEIYNIVGDRIYSATIKRQLQLVNCKIFSPGIYFVKINDQERQYCKKLIVQR